jgi:hypothetical protein
MPIQKVNDSVGCIARRTAVQVGNDVLFLSDDGVRSLQQVIGSDQQHDLSLPLSFPVQDYIHRVNWSMVSEACAVFWNNLYLLAVPLDSSVTNNYVFVFNTITSTWSGIWLSTATQSMPIRCFGVRKGNTQSLMMGLHTDNVVIEYLDYVHEDDAVDATYADYNGLPVLPVALTRAMTFGDTKAFKKGLDYEVEWIGTKGSIIINPIMDEDTLLPADNLTLTGGGFPIPFPLPFLITRPGVQRQQFDLMRHKVFRELQLQIVAAGDGKKQLRQITAQAFVEPGNFLQPQVPFGTP